MLQFPGLFHGLCRPQQLQARYDMSCVHTRTAHKLAHATRHASLVDSIATLDQAMRMPLQSYISTSKDAALNLSIEHYILQKTEPNSIAILLYINRPSIIIGRNQNPWLEVNLRCLDARRQSSSDDSQLVSLVRRRSGGGTVFHDEGNLNWSIVTPSAGFDRDKGVAMVVQALRRSGVTRARGTKRHDIVVGQEIRSSSLNPDHEDTSRCEHDVEVFHSPLKVSGSAYKLIKDRALHHGTCLLSSRYIDDIPVYLRSPAKQYISAQGVESVRSPVTNTNVEMCRFISSLHEAFSQLYSGGEEIPTVFVGDELRSHKDIKTGYDELISAAWTFQQTPKFTISLPIKYPTDGVLDLMIVRGVVQKVKWRSSDSSLPLEKALGNDLQGRALHEISQWKSTLAHTSALASCEMLSAITNALDEVLPPCTPGRRHVS